MFDRVMHRALRGLMISLGALLLPAMQPAAAEEEGPRIEIDTFAVPVGETVQAQVVGAPEGAQPVFAVADPSVATVDEETGEVTGRAVGVTRLHATVGDLELSYDLGVPERYLTVDDFEFDGQYKGGSNARAEEIGPNHFAVRSTRQYEIHASMVGQRFRVFHPGMGWPSGLPERSGGHIHNMHLSSSIDNRHWTPKLQTVVEDGAYFTFGPYTTGDAFYQAGQIPMSHELGERLIREWANNPRTAKYVTISQVGESVQGRALYKVEITDPDSDIPRSERWSHWASSAHPHEGKARWRVWGVGDWLLSDDPVAVDARRRSIWHLALMMCPDSIAHGRSRYNMEGTSTPHDMNRSYLADGSDPEGQIQETYHYQREIERIMASDEPLTTFTDMHVWGNQVEPMTRLGPEFGTGEGQLGDWTVLRDFFDDLDHPDHVKTLAVRGGRGGGVTWDSGVHGQFGITATLCEGGGTVDTQEQNIQTGRVYAKAYSLFYNGTKNDFTPHPAGE